MDHTNKNTTVWAKLRYCSHWPAYIVENPPATLKNKISKRKVCVFFFGSRNYGIVQIENSHPYLKCKSKYTKKNRTALFQKAVREVDDYMDFGGDHQSACLPNTSGRILVKTELEHDVKVENLPEEMYSTDEVDVRMKPIECDSCSMKQMQIDDLNEKLKLTTTEYATSQTEYQILFIENNKKDRAITKIQLNCISLEQQLNDLGKKYRNHDKRLQTLTLQNITLETQLEEAELGQGLYEVEKIIQHKKIRGKLSYLIRWVGYGAGEDRWIKEDDFHCKEILGSYKNLHML